MPHTIECLNPSHHNSIIFSDLITEIWEFSENQGKTIQPVLTNGNYQQGIALYVVDINFCLKYR